MLNGVVMTFFIYIYAIAHVSGVQAAADKDMASFAHILCHK